LFDCFFSAWKYEIELLLIFLDINSTELAETILLYCFCVILHL